jgi:hypothetical protein
MVRFGTNGLVTGIPAASASHRGALHILQQRPRLTGGLHSPEQLLYLIWPPNLTGEVREQPHDSAQNIAFQLVLEPEDCSVTAIWDTANSKFSAVTSMIA